tara:strand:- start:6244 stop:7023 length:780 start_codon:yes stop_codon:yes gene_type:complete
MDKSLIDIYWDFENLRLPNSADISDITNNLRTKLNNFGIINKRNIYIDSRSPTENATKRIDINLSGWSIIDCPHRRKKETVDKKIMIDIFMSLITYKVNNYPNVIICVVTSDTDFCELFNKLRDIGVKICLISDARITYQLKNSADFSLDWDIDIINYRPNTKNEKSEEIDIIKLNDVNTVENTSKGYSQLLKEFLVVIEGNLNDNNFARISDIATQWYASSYCKNMDNKSRKHQIRDLIKKGINNNIIVRDGEYVTFK